ncbi:MAG: efflux RND transporter periplasmic adaptor subunit [Hyphomicrobiaceae bacterium]|nr:efflux RND transporter periplasmic adaptor subunit [Hyphomicrobiaceae bacterium]
MKPRTDLQSETVTEAARLRELEQAASTNKATAARPGGASPLRLASRAARLLLQAVLPILVLAVAVAGFSYMKATKPEVAKRKPREVVYSVATLPVAIGNVLPKLTLYGTTVAGRQVELRSLVAGRVIETGPGLRDGAIVQKDDVLLRIDPFDFQAKIKETRAQLAEAKARRAEMLASVATEEGNLKFARAQLELARTDLQRAVPLARRGTVTEQTVDNRRLVVFQREQAVTQSSNTISVWKARIAQQDAVIDRLGTALAQAEKRLEETVLRAPFNAYVASIGAQVGRMLGANDSVATLIDKDWVDVRFTLTNAQYGRLAGGREELIGRKLSLEWIVGRKAFTYEAKIERIGARVTSNTGGVDVYARLADPLRPVPVRPGVFMTVTLNDARFESVARVPSTAVYDNARVFVVEQGRMRERKIEVIGVDGADVLVTGELKAGDKVVTTRLSTPGNGVRVQEQASRGKS